MLLLREMIVICILTCQSYSPDNVFNSHEEILKWTQYKK